MKTIAIIIPTKNRPHDLSELLKSILLSNVKPNELIIVDQSINEDSKNNAIKLLNKNENKIKIKYIVDKNINGLVEAKKYGAQICESEIVFFLEDDVIIEKNYIEEIMLEFLKNSKMMGCSGVITNVPKRTYLKKILFEIFHLGIFKDKRYRIYENLELYQNKVIPSNMISGGISAWRINILETIKFDIKSGFHFFEDIEFSTRVFDIHPDSLFIITKAKLSHNYSQINRFSIEIAQEKKVIESIKYYTKRSKYRYASISLIWLLIGLFFDSIHKFIVLKRKAVLINYFRGLKKGIFLSER